MVNFVMEFFLHVGIKSQDIVINKIYFPRRSYKPKGSVILKRNAQICIYLLFYETYSIIFLEKKGI